MAYDRYDTRNMPRDDRSRWQNDRDTDRFSGRHPGHDWRGDRGREEDRGFFERAGDEIASWFGDDDAERRRREDQRREETERGWSGRENRERGWSQRERMSERDRGYGRGAYYEPTSGYRPMTGDYGRSERYFAGSDYGRTEPLSYGGDVRYDRSPTSRDIGIGREQDPHYRSWRDRHLSELDRDYDEYRRENQARFESDFGSWRERRQHKRGLLGQIREHMEVIGSDDQHVGTVDRIAGDRVILTKSDPESGGVHHSLSCADIDRVEGDRVILDWSAEQARQRWRDESRSRALFEREDQGEIGPRMLDRSFEGTYR